MWKKLSVFLIPTVLFVTQPLQVLAQQSQSPNTPPPPQWYGPGPWHMWADGYGYGWHFWWMGPVMMLFMILICVAVIYFLFSRHSGGSHQWGPITGRQWDAGYSALAISGRALRQRRDSEGRVSGKEGHYSLWSIALIGNVVGRRHGDVQQRQKAMRAISIPFCP